MPHLLGRRRPLSSRQRQRLLTLAAQSAPALPKLAAVCADGCKQCQTDCEKHKEYPQCKACAAACVACYDECKKLA